MVTCSYRIDVDASKRDGELTVAGTTLHTPAFAPADVSELWMNGQLRGEGKLIPGRPGRLKRPRRVDETTRQVPFVIDGQFDHLGNQHADERQGLVENVLYIRSTFTDPSQVGDGSVALVLTSPDGSIEFTGDVYLDLEVGSKQRGLWRAILDVTIPAGALDVAEVANP